MSPRSWLSGEHRTLLDPEGRLLLPLALRNTLNPGGDEVTLMATLEPEGCVGIRRVDQWDDYVGGLRALAGQSLRHRRLMLVLAATSSQVKLDRQGRLRIQDSLLAKAGVERSAERSAKTEVVIAGHFDDLRIWASTRWDEFCLEALRDFGADLEWLHLGDRAGSAAGTTDKS